MAARGPSPCPAIIIIIPPHPSHIRLPSPSSIACLGAPIPPAPLSLQRRLLQGALGWGER